MNINDISQQINARVSKSILTIEFHRPDKMNSFTFEMYRTLTQILEYAKKEDEIRVVVLTGSEGNFSAGNDIQDFVSVIEQDGMGRGHDAPAFIDALREFPKPVVAAVEGFAVGVGATLTLYCDLVYASPDAQFRTPFTHLGLCPEGAASYILPRIMGRARAGEWLLLGDVISAEQALSDGVVTRVCENPVEMAQEKAGILSKMSPKAIADTKKLMSSQNEILRKAFDEEMIKFRECLETKEARAAFKHFLER